jgi:imidazolonepropionase-like amidohydrolase
MSAPRRSHRVGAALGRLGAFGANLRDAAGAVGASGARTLRERRGVTAARAGLDPLERGVALIGTVWTGGKAEMFEGVVVVDGRGTVVYLGPQAEARLPDDLRRIGGPGCWIGPGVVDAHVHLSFGSVDDCLRRGLVGVRDLGAAPDQAREWRTGHRAPAPGRPFVAVSGPMLTAPRGYPTRSWGSDALAAFVTSPAQARQTIQRIAAAGVDVIKLALEPGDFAWPVPTPRVVRAVVEAAHDAGLAVVAHALRVEMVRLAVLGGVDELAHTPIERLPEELIEQIAAAGISVVSTLQTFFADGSGREAAANAAALYEAGIVLRYGTDLGNTGTQPGVDPRELDRLADAGLGRLGALRAATEGSAQAAGMRRRTGYLRVDEPAALVVLPANPIDEPGAWRAPVAVLADGALIVN